MLFRVVNLVCRAKPFSGTRPMAKIHAIRLASAASAAVAAIAHHLALAVAIAIAAAVAAAT
jgi:hypothetical protein